MAKFAMTAADKMRNLELAHYKTDITDCQFRLLFVLHSEVDRTTGFTDIDYKSLAQLCGRDVRTVERGTTKLAEKGLLRKLRKEIGRTASGRPIFGGWGGKNRYDLTGCAVANVAETCTAPKTSELDRPARRDRSTEETKSIDPPRPNTLSLTHPHKDPSDIGNESETTPPEAWRTHLLSLIGADKMYAWFRGLKIRDIRDGICYLTIPSPAAKTAIRSQYYDYLLQALQAQDGSITEICIDIKK